MPLVQRMARAYNACVPNTVPSSLQRMVPAVYKHYMGKQLVNGVNHYALHFWAQQQPETLNSTSSQATPGDVLNLPLSVSLGDK